MLGHLQGLLTPFASGRGPFCSNGFNLNQADRMLDMGFEPQVRKMCTQVRHGKLTCQRKCVYRHIGCWFCTYIRHWFIKQVMISNRRFISYITMLNVFDWDICLIMFVTVCYVFGHVFFSMKKLLCVGITAQRWPVMVSQRNKTHENMIWLCIGLRTFEDKNAKPRQTTRNTYLHLDPPLNCANWRGIVCFNG